MATHHTDVRLLLSQELKDIRSKIVEGKLVLFVGEQVSILVTPDQPRPSLDYWWQLVNHSEQNGVKKLLDFEEKFLENLQQVPSRIHSALRNVGNFPFIITTNMDELLERFLWKTGNGGEKIRLDQVSNIAQSWPDLRRDVVIKCFGDGGFNVRALPTSKKFFEEFCSTLKSPEVEFMHQVFNDRSVLFLGCDTHREEYRNMFQKFAVGAKMKHYKFETSGESDLERDGNLITLKANIQPWEFVQFLSTGTIQKDIQPGKVYERSYLRIQREEYLQQQLTLEKMASEIVFHTIAITNALSPDDFFEEVSRPTIQSIFKQDPFGVYSEEKVQRTVDAMKQRRDNLIRLIDESRETTVTALFFYHGVQKEIELWKEAEKSPSLSEGQKQNLRQKCKISISKYAKAILRCKSLLRSNSSLEIRIVGDQDTYNVQEVEKETFALIRLKGGQDEAVCYAETATSPDDRKFANHLININGDVVLNKRKIYERSRASAWGNEDSILKLATAIMKENSEMKERFHIDAIDEEDLKALETLTRISQKVRSQLDPGYLEPLGEGNFGQVYQAKKNGQTVAVKILKRVEERDIQCFEREVDMLRKAKHPQIVEVIECISIQNQLAIVMEFMAGGNLKVFLEKQNRGQGKEFTLRFTKDIGSAVEHLHSLDIIHRDIKPENILLSNDHTVLKLGDFGLARATEGTRQTKTFTGSYRYMAPEVTKKGHYSKKADVYSFGLCLIEVLSGKTVFADILQPETVHNKKLAGQNPTIPDISFEEFGEELATKLRTIVEGCLKPANYRPKMDRLLGLLRGKVASHKNKVELYCVGTGTGTTAVLHGKPSSSVIVFQNGKPLLMVDVGAGVLKPSREILDNNFPRNVFISHNHMDHSGELPMLFAVESKRRHQAGEPRLKVLCGPEVEQKLKIHRLDEMLSLYRPEQVAEWVVCQQNGDPTYLDEASDFFIKVYRTLHGEVCYGFLLFFKDNPILGYCVDSGFKEDVYEFFFQASTVVVDARKDGSKEHASFTEVADYVKKQQFSNKQVYITGYGIDSEYTDEGVPGVEQLHADQYVTLWDKDTDGF